MMQERESLVDSCHDDMDNLSGTSSIQYYGECVRVSDLRRPITRRIQIRHPAFDIWDYLALEFASSLRPETLLKTSTLSAAWAFGRQRQAGHPEDMLAYIPPEARFRVRLRVGKVIEGEPTAVRSEELSDGD